MFGLLAVARWMITAVAVLPPSTVVVAMSNPSHDKRNTLSREVVREIYDAYARKDDPVCWSKRDGTKCATKICHSLKSKRVTMVAGLLETKKEQSNRNNENYQ